MKILKNLSIYFLTLIILVSAFSFSTSAASNATIAFSSNTVTVGDSVTVTVTVNPGQTFNAVSYNISYDESILEFVSSDQATGGAGVLKVVESFGDKTSVSYSAVFTAIATGTCGITVDNCLWSAGGSTETPFDGASASLTVKDIKLSNNANLSSLSINTGAISPKFSKNTTTYTASVPFEVTKVNVAANVADSTAKVVSVTGNTLKVGKNDVVVTVRAADGTQKKYTIVVTRKEEVKETPSKPESKPESNVSSKPENSTSSKEETADDNKTKLETNVDGENFTIVEEIPEDKVLNGFQNSKTEFNNTEVDVLTDKGGNFTIYYLDSEDGSDDFVPFIYNEETNNFEQLKYITVGENVYIFSEIPADFTVPENMYPSNIQISDFSVKCLSYNNPELEDFHYVYCYSNGAYGYYRYDSFEKTIQRFPDLQLVASVDTEQEKETSSNNLIERFTSLSTNGKIILICLAIAVIGAVTLIIFLIIYIIKKFAKGNDDFLIESLSDDFDEIEENEQIIEDDINETEE